MDPDVEIMFVTKQGKLICESETNVQMSRSFCRRTLTEDEVSVETIWSNRIKENPRLFNGTKFRLHSVAFDDSGCFTLNLGLTDYREYLGTNWSPEVKQIQAEGQRKFGDPQAFLSDPMGVGAFVITSDDHVIFLKRSQHCAEAPGMWDVPGGHAEPDQLVGKMPVSEIEIESQMPPGSVAHEIFDSILREVTDEVNILPDNLSPPLLVGIAKNTTSGSRPSVEFLIQSSCDKDQVVTLYKQGSHAEADESTDIMLVPLQTVLKMQSENPALWDQVAPSAKGCVLLYKLSMGC